LGANHGGGFAKNHSLSPKDLLSLECLHHEVQKTKKGYRVKIQPIK